MLLKTSAWLLLVISITQIYAQLDDPSPEGCVDPSGFSKCSGEANSNYISCSFQTCNNNVTCENACQNALSGAQLACWTQSCWNQLASCYYQDQVILYLSQGIVTDIPPSIMIPFFPPPDGVGGACQCNLGKLYELWSLANSTAGQDPCPTGSDCACCFQSALISAYYDLCPTGNIDFAGGFIASLNATNAALASPNQCQILRSPSNPEIACAAYGSPPFGAKEYLDFVSLPSGFPGTTLTDLVGSVTALGVSASTTILSLVDLTTTITYAPYTGVSGATGPSGGNPTLSPNTSASESVSWKFGPTISSASGSVTSNSETSALGTMTSAGITSPAQTLPPTASPPSSTPMTTITKSVASRGRSSAFFWVTALGAMLLL